jgi:hypothetical protein
MAAGTVRSASEQTGCRPVFLRQQFAWRCTFSGLSGTNVSPPVAVQFIPAYSGLQYFLYYFMVKCPFKKLISLFTF